MPHVDYFVAANEDQSGAWYGILNFDNSLSVTVCKSFQLVPKLLMHFLPG